MKHSFFSTSILAALLLGACAARNPHDIANPDPNHTHADFAVWIDGQKMDFSDEEFMSESEDGQTEDDHEAHGHRHHPYLHLHDADGNVVHRHKPGLSIGDFFASIQIGIDGNCYTSFAPLADEEICGEHTFRMFINGKEMPLNLAYVFDDLDQILFTNAVDDAEVLEQVKHMTDDACRYSQRCPWRGTPPVENCVADPKVPCVE